MPKAVDKVGMVFDQLTVVAHAGKNVKSVALRYQEQLPPALFCKLYTGTENYLNYYMFEKEKSK